MDKQQKDSLRTFIERSRKDRLWEEANLPIYRSMIGRDLFFYFAAMHLRERLVAVKEIYLDMPYSENAVRLHLKRLARDGWIALPKDAEDKRLRQVELRPRLISAMERYFNLMLRDQAGRSAAGRAHNARSHSLPA